MPDTEVAEAISRRLLEIDYGNFKASVRDSKRHDAYWEVWDVMYRMQERAKVKER